MARAIYRINEFIGIDQSRDENALKSAMSPDACNMDTAGGNLSVCRGCVTRSVRVRNTSDKPFSVERVHSAA